MDLQCWKRIKFEEFFDKKHFKNFARLLAFFWELRDGLREVCYRLRYEETLGAELYLWNSLFCNIRELSLG